MITSLTKLLYEAKNSLGVRIEPKALHIDFKSEKRYKELIEENFQKPKLRDINEEEKIEEDYMMNNMDGSTRETTALSSKKSVEILQIEDEYNALMQQSIVLRRGRCGRMFAKYVQKSIFEDTSDTFRDQGNSDNEQDDDKKTVLKKRRKKYQDLFEYLHMDSYNCNDGGVYQGLLMRDQKYLRKNMHKVCQLSVKESATRLIKK